MAATIIQKALGDCIPSQHVRGQWFVDIQRAGTGDGNFNRDLHLPVVPGLPDRFTLRTINFICNDSRHVQACEPLKMSFLGKYPCRRCEVFNNNRGMFTNVWEKTRIPEKLRTMEDIEQAVQCLNDRNPLAAKEFGVRGKSILLRLYQQQGFNLLHDSVFDVLHTIALKLFHDNNNYMWKVVTEVGKADIACGRLQEMLARRSSLMRTGRPPEHPLTRIGYWKAEEHQHFAQ